MNTAQNLIGGSQSNNKFKAVPNIALKERNPLYNPAIPMMNDSNNNFNKKDSRDVKLKDMFYRNMLLDNNVRNGSGFTMGENTKGLDIWKDYDRAFDPNLLRRRDKNNKLFTMPDDFYTGSYGAYYSLPNSIRIPSSMGSNMNAGALQSSMFDGYSYKNRFSDADPNKPSLPIPINPTMKDIRPSVNVPNSGFDTLDDIPDIYPSTPINYHNNIVRSPYEDITSNRNRNASSYAPIGNDPTEDPNYTNRMEQIRKDQEQSILDRERYRNQKTPSWFNTDKRDLYNRPTIRSGTRTPMRHVENYNTITNPL